MHLLVGRGGGSPEKSLGPVRGEQAERGVEKMQEFRCKKCKKLLGRYHQCKQLEIKCPRCSKINILSQPPVEKTAVS
ncbi:MAG: Com family DNA-binding transcriptional regulator [Syntrophomonas sp.]